jgi:hypothetical protein
LKSLLTKENKVLRRDVKAWIMNKKKLNKIEKNITLESIKNQENLIN